jgi:hypothetical protein
MGAQVRRIALACSGSLKNTFRDEGTRALRSAPEGERGASFVKGQLHDRDGSAIIKACCLRHLGLLRHYEVKVQGLRTEL